MTLMIFVEGHYDSLFFSNLIEPNLIKIVEYHRKKVDEIEKIIKTLKSSNKCYIFLADLDVNTPDSLIEKLTNLYKYLDECNIFIVKMEIESWFYAGIEDKLAKRLKIKPPGQNTENINKERFVSLFQKKDEYKNQLLLIMENYNANLACERNNSFKEFYSSLSK